MKKLDYYVENKEYEICIIGTGLTESLFAASLSKIDRSKILVIAADHGYGSGQKTLNLKELKNEAENHRTANKQNYFKLKQSFYETIELGEERNASNEKLLHQLVDSSTLFKQFNIDLQPKLIFSKSLSVDFMQQARMDQYMDFRAVENSFIYCEKTQKFTETACSKEDIFKSKIFSLLEKKQLFQFLHRCIALQNKILGRSIDPNSLAEFDKHFELDESVSEEFLNSPCSQFLTKYISSKWIQDILLFGICTFEQDPRNKLPSFIESEYSTREFLSRLFKYLSSSGVHTKLPFLYTNYGSGDVPQGYVRIAAIFGAAFCLDEDICINKLKIDKENKSFLIRSNLTPQPDEISNKKTEQKQTLDHKQVETKNENSQSQLINPPQQDDKQNESGEEKIEQTAPISEYQPDELKEVINQESQQTSSESNENQNENYKKTQEEQQIPNKNDEKQNENDSESKVEQQTLIEKDEKQKESEPKVSGEEATNAPLQEETFINAKKIVVGPQYKQKILQLLDFPTKQATEITQLLRVIIISKKSEEQIQFEKEIEQSRDDEDGKSQIFQLLCPLLYQIPPNQQFSEPVLMLQLDNHTSSAPKGYQIFCCKKILKQGENPIEESQKIIDTVSKMHLQLPQSIPFSYSVDYVWSYLQTKDNTGAFSVIDLSGNEKKNEETQKKEDFLLAMIGQDGFEIDMERNFKEFKNNISQISGQVNSKDENYFQTVQELNGEVDFYLNKVDEGDDENDEDYGVKGLVSTVISKFENLKSKEKQEDNLESDNTKKNENEEVPANLNPGNQTQEDTLNVESKTENTTIVENKESLEPIKAEGLQEIKVASENSEELSNN